jgi:hypothetical protein
MTCSTRSPARAYRRTVLPSCVIPHRQLLKFLSSALTIGVCFSLPVYFGLSEATALKMCVVPALIVANVVDDQWFFSGSTCWGGIAFWWAVTLQWTLFGWLAFRVWSWAAQKRRDS